MLNSEFGSFFLLEPVLLLLQRLLFLLLTVFAAQLQLVPHSCTGSGFIMSQVRGSLVFDRSLVMQSSTSVDKVFGEHRLGNACLVQHLLCELAVSAEQIHTRPPSAAHRCHVLLRDLSSAQPKLSCQDVIRTGTNQATL